MSSFVPNFDLSGGSVMSDAEFDKELEKDSKRGSRFQAGHYELEIKNAYFDGVANDPNWVKVKLELGDDDKSIKHTIMMPTTLNHMYQKPGGKPTLFVWSKMFSPLFQAIGEQPKPSTLAKIVSKYTKNLKEVDAEVWEDGSLTEKKVSQLAELVGKTVELELGYDGPYIKKKDETEQFAIYKNDRQMEIEGELLEGESFEDCIGLAVEHDLKIARLGVLKFYAKQMSEQSDAFDDL